MVGGAESGRKKYQKTPNMRGRKSPQEKNDFARVFGKNAAYPRAI
jgi:hypothetical protein